MLSILGVSAQKDMANIHVILCKTAKGATRRSTFKHLAVPGHTQNLEPVGSNELP